VRCRDGKSCFDDLCHMTEQTLCGIWVNEAEEADDTGEDEWGEEYDDDDWENGRLHSGLGLDQATVPHPDRTPR